MSQNMIQDVDTHPSSEHENISDLILYNCETSAYREQFLWFCYINL